MGRDWNAFIKAVDRAPREFAKAIVDHLDPPQYARKALRKLMYLCGWPGCWTVRIDSCFKCDRGVCEDHSEMFLGPKTRLEWYVCNGCLDSVPRKDLLKEIAEEDEQFWQEDQEAAEVTDAIAQGDEAARAQHEEEEQDREDRDAEQAHHEGQPPY